ncbi:LysR family transcriptional regulator [Olsenella profusa]|nr:LysR family transcriptional regulator [Olsenella profusa]
MELEQLRQLDALEREGTMTAAARRLHVSQPALSRSIQRLEAELGQALLSRAGRRVALNEAGRVAVDWARQILRDERLLREAVAAVGQRARTLRVGTVAPAPLWRLTSLMVERLPEETLTSETIRGDEALRGLADGALDLGIVAEKPAGADLLSCKLMRESLSVALPPNHPLAARPNVTADNLDGQTFLIFTEIGVWRDAVDRALPHATLIEQRDRSVFSRLARTTPHCVFTTDAPYLEAQVPGRAIVPVEGDWAHFTFWLATRADARDTVRQLFDWVRSQGTARRG